MFLKHSHWTSVFVHVWIEVEFLKIEVAYCDSTKLTVSPICVVFNDLAENMDLV